MCGTFGQSQWDWRLIEAYVNALFGDVPPDNPMDMEKDLRELGILFQSTDNLERPTNYSIVPGDTAYVFTTEQPLEPGNATFGYTIQHRDQTRFIFNLRIEGFHNKENDPSYNGPCGIFGNPYCQELIASQRAVLWANFFVENPTGNRKRKFLVKRQDEGLFPIAGVYDKLVDTSTGEITLAFALLTTAGTSITTAIGHARSPLILPPEKVLTYLRASTSREELQQLMRPADTNDYLAFEVDAAISKKNKPFAIDSDAYVEATGQLVYPG